LVDKDQAITTGCFNIIKTKHYQQKFFLGLLTKDTGFLVLSTKNTGFLLDKNGLVG